MTQIEAKNLRSQKDNLQMMIFRCVQLKQDAKTLIVEYHKIVDQLVKNGYKVYIRAPYLKLDYWDLTPNDVYNYKKINETPTPTNIGSQNNYIINLAWNESSNIKNNVEKINEYIINIGLEKVDEEFNDVLTETEHLIKYKYRGTEESFKLLKIGLNEIINIFYNGNSNIAIYGSKQNF